MTNHPILSAVEELKMNELTPMMSERLVFHVFSNDFEWVVAANLEDARMVVMDQLGWTETDFRDEDWSQEPDDADLRIWVDERTGEVSDGGVLVIGTMAVWAEVFGRGFLCTTEY